MFLEYYRKSCYPSAPKQFYSNFLHATHVTDIVIVGGGPVGLWTAVQLKKRMPGAQIRVYERHTVYQRSHVLRLDHWSLMLYASSAHDSPEKSFVREVTGKSLSGMKAQFAKSLYIRTNDLEAALSRYAQALGIEVTLQKIEGTRHAEQLHPECYLFLAADGAHSPLRTDLFGEDCLDYDALQHVVEVKCEEDAGDAARALKLGTGQLWKLNKTLGHTAAEYVGKQRDGKAPVTLRLFLEKDEYAELPAMSFKSPASLTTPGLPTAVARDIQAYLATRVGHGAVLVPDSVRITKLELSVYASRQFAVMREGRAWFLVGDAAMGVPYFRALNSGLMLASRLSQIISRTTYLKKGSLARKVFRYNSVYRPMHVATEFAIARSKNWVLDSVHTAREWLAEDTGA